MTEGSSNGDLPNTLVTTRPIPYLPRYAERCLIQTRFNVGTESASCDKCLIPKLEVSRDPDIVQIEILECHFSFP